MIHPRHFIMMCLVCFLMIPILLSAAELQPPPEGGTLPEVLLPVPEDPVQRAYLGLKQTGDFRIPDIAAEIVIVEIFSMY